MYAIEGVHHELMGAPAVMDIAGPGKDIEELPGLSHRAVQVVVAARALLLGIVSNRGTFHVSASGGHRSIEVQGQAGKALTPQSVDHQRRAQGPHLFDTITAHGGQRPADGGYIR